MSLSNQAAFTRVLKILLWNRKYVRFTEQLLVSYLIKSYKHISWNRSTLNFFFFFLVNFQYLLINNLKHLISIQISVEMKSVVPGQYRGGQLQGRVIFIVCIYIFAYITLSLKEYWFLSWNYVSIETFFREILRLEN